jgi:hypothetical protein
MNYPFKSRICRLLVEIFCLKKDEVVFEIFTKMKNEKEFGIEFVISSYFLKLTKMTKDPKIIFEKYEQIFEIGLEHSDYSYHVILTALMEVNDVKYSSLLLNDNRKSFTNNAITYNIILSNYLENKYSREKIFHLIDEIFFKKIEISGKLFTTLLKVYNIYGRESDVMRLLKYISYYEMDVPLYSSIINIASKCI